ncbi:hypothetical protein [Brevundimonas sp.]|jgi:hypothetical protein|uniref:hypothetical protein n=1 Tax=Brevundimonas sp. TaxID=1871086 RepID=UPI00378481A0
MVIKTKRKPTGAAAKGAGPGRPKGVKNKVTAELKDMILQALDNAGGVSYLTQRASDPKTASAFLTLVGKTLPMTVKGPGEGGEFFQKIVVEVVQAK